MWENYLVMERLKLMANQPFPPRSFFWRTRAPSSNEVDYIEESSGKLRAWEFKSKPETKASIPVSFRNAYPDAETGIITPSNYEKFLLPGK